MNRCKLHKWNKIEWETLPWGDKSADLHPGCYSKLIKGVAKVQDKYQEHAIHQHINNMVDLIVCTVGIKDFDYTGRGKILMGALIKDVMDKTNVGNQKFTRMEASAHWKHILEVDAHDKSTCKNHTCKRTRQAQDEEPEVYEILDTPSPKRMRYTHDEPQTSYESDSSQISGMYPLIDDKDTIPFFELRRQDTVQDLQHTPGVPNLGEYVPDDIINEDFKPKPEQMEIDNDFKEFIDSVDIFQKETDPELESLLAPIDKETQEAILGDIQLVKEDNPSEA